MPALGFVAVAPLLAFPPLLAAQITEDTPGCSRLPIPERIAAIGDVLDVGRLSAALAAADIGVDPVHALITVRFDERGAAQHVRVLASSVDSTTDEAVRGALAGAVVAQPAAEPWGIRVMLVLGDAPSLQFERAELCPPEPLAIPEHRVREVRSEIVQGPVPVVRPPVPRPTTPLRLRVLVDEDGKVARSEILVGSGSAHVDEEVRSDWEHVRFHPATLDGIPITRWFEVEPRRDRVRTPRGR